MDELLAAVAEAFPQIPFSEIASPASWTEMLGTYLHADEFQDGISGQSWNTLDARFIEAHHDVISYLEPRGFAAVLPACLTAFIRDDEALDQLPLFLLKTLTRGKKTARFDARVGALTRRQLAVVACVLEALARSERHSAYGDEIAAALESYWRDVGRSTED